MEIKDRAMAKPLNGKTLPKNEGKTIESASGTNASEVKADASETPAKTEEMKSVPKEGKEAILIPIASASDRLSRLEVFQKLAERFNFLKDKSQELKKFNARQDSTQAKIELSCVGATVQITNSEIIKEVVNLCQGKLDTLLANTEAEITSFHI